jgi:hypothetical protein
MHRRAQVEFKSQTHGRQVLHVLHVLSRVAVVRNVVRG